MKFMNYCINSLKLNVEKRLIKFYLGPQNFILRDTLICAVINLYFTMYAIVL
jgi:hypothetical protein